LTLFVSDNGNDECLNEMSYFINLIISMF